MNINKRLIAFIVEIVVGAILLILAALNVLDEYWSGMGTALIIVAIVQLIRIIRYKTNTQYRESVDVEVNDERNRYISMKAWSWAGYIFVMISAVASIVLKVLGQDQYMKIASGSICLILVLYWVSYYILRKKY